MTFGVVMKIFGKFAYLFIVSLLMGLAFGLASALLLKRYNVSTYPQASLASQHLHAVPPSWEAPWSGQVAVYTGCGPDRHDLVPELSGGRLSGPERHRQPLLLRRHPQPLRAAQHEQEPARRHPVLLRDTLLPLRGLHLCLRRPGRPGPPEVGGASQPLFSLPARNISHTDCGQS